MRFLFKKLFLFFISLFFFEIVFCDIILTNCSKHKLKVSFFEYIASGVGYCEEVLPPGAYCFVPYNTKFTIYYRRHKFKFDKNTFNNYDDYGNHYCDYKILFNVNRRLSRISIVCRIVYEKIIFTKGIISHKNILCGSESYHSIKFQRPAVN